VGTVPPVGRATPVNSVGRCRLDSTSLRKLARLGSSLLVPLNLGVYLAGKELSLIFYFFVFPFFYAPNRMFVVLR